MLEQRRSNLLIEHVDLLQVSRMLVKICGGVVLEITHETHSCERMAALAPGLKAALLPIGVAARVRW